jgi:hypothetical protein
MKSKQLVIYEDKRTGSLFIRATRDKNGNFVLKSSDECGKAISGKVSDDELGRAVREVLQNCE